MFIDGMTDLEGNSLLAESATKKVQLFNLAEVELVRNFGVLYADFPIQGEKLIASILKQTDGDVVISMYVNSEERERITLAGADTEAEKVIDVYVPQGSTIFFNIESLDADASNLSLQLNYSV